MRASHWLTPGAARARTQRTSRSLRRAPQPIQVVAHRGASVDAPEHTLEAYEQAVAQGADALECDVRLTRDGHLVCVHDRRVDRTSSGHGPVSTLELAQLSELDWRSWHPAAERSTNGEQTEALHADGSGVLTLRRLLGMVADSGRRIEVAVETKHPTRYAGLVERHLVGLLETFGWARAKPDAPSPVRVMSFSHVSLRRMRRLAPDVPRVYLMERVPLRFRDGSLPPGVHIGGPSIELLRAQPSIAAQLHAAGNAVHVWTVDEPADVRLCARLGVQAVITNRPGMARDVLAG